MQETVAIIQQAYILGIIKNIVALKLFSSTGTLCTCDRGRLIGYTQELAISFSLELMQLP